MNILRYLKDADAAYDQLEGVMMNQLKVEVKSAVELLNNNAFTRDPWLWDLNWKPGSRRTRRARFIDQLVEEGEVGRLTAYPTWFQELAEEEDGKCFLNITTSKRVVPKILRLTWKGFPLHFDKKEKWGYLVPSSNAKDVLELIQEGSLTSEFPLEQFLEAIDEQKSKRQTESTDIFIDQVSDFSDSDFFNSRSKKASSPKADDDLGKGIDVGIPGVLFQRLPHKNGPRFRVGNPLGKDFLAACGEGGALASKIDKLASELLKISSQLAYWRNARDRLMEQVKVDLVYENLPNCVKEDGSFSEGNTYSAILPSLVVSGTVTRRAVEKTWLTASNSRPDRVGSELKTAIRAPPGYCFVGADVDSQELWLASVLGDAVRGGHGATPLGWMSLQGEKSNGTDLHSKAAAAAQVTRDQAKILNYARIYGAGETFAKLLLKQFNPDLTDTEVTSRARHMYEQTKGLRGYKLNAKGKWLYDFLMEKKDGYQGEMISKKLMNILAKKMVFMNRIVKESKDINHKDKIIFCHVLTEEAKVLYSQYLGSSVEESRELLLDDNKLKVIY